jgi:hypothetical protein
MLLEEAKMRVWKLSLLIAGVCGWLAPARVTAQVSGAISADPNPCKIATGQRECTTYLHWNTRGAQSVKVFVTAEGKHSFVEKEFSTVLNCEGEKCRAPWITDNTKFLFQLVDFSSGSRGKVISSVWVTSKEDPWGSIRAQGSPCRIGPGRHECEVVLNWEAHGVDQAKVFVSSEGKKSAPEKEFGVGLSCEGNCRAPWIEADTRYLFQLVDFSHGNKGRVLGSVTVTASK